MLPPRLALRLAWASALSILIAYTAAASIGRTTHGFIAYYGAARLFIDGELSADAYDDGWFHAYVQRITDTGVREIFTLWGVHVFGVRNWFRRFPESSSV